MDLDRLLDMQKDLMAKVPHKVRPDVYPTVKDTVYMFIDTLEYLGSLGHKPWRSNPLSKDEINKRMYNMAESFRSMASSQKMSQCFPLPVVDEVESRKIISGLGIIEETLEYLSAVEKSEPADSRLEELTDILFFYLEQVILSGFSLQQIEEQYIKKHAINLKRYEDGKKGDFRWDNREKGL